MAQYRTGTVAVTNGSAAVVGTGTAWAAEVSAGDLFILANEGITYEVGSVTDNTNLALTANYAGATGSALEYAIARDFTPAKGLPYPAKGDIETAAVLRRAMYSIDSFDTGYSYYAYASDDQGTGFTLTFDTALDYVAHLLSAVEIATPVAGDFAGLWKNVRGPQGIQGPPGKTWLSGSGAPSDAAGVDGDFYLDTLNDAYYGPKAGGTWAGSGPQSLIGAQGPAWDQWKGPWLTATPYIIKDGVSNGGSSYICTSAHTSGSISEPGAGSNWESYWDVIAEKGTTSAGDIAGAIHAAASKTTFDDLDEFPLLNRAASFGLEKISGGVLRSALLDPYGFSKLDSGSVAFTKTAAGTISIKAGTKVIVAGVVVNIAVAATVVMPALTAGTDYAIYACTDGTIRADASFTAPAGYTTETSRLIGGFHYGLVAPATTVAGGSFATTGNGMIWTQADVDLIAGINVFSLWDLKWRAASNDSLLRAQKGFSFVNGLWVANYLCSTDHIANG